MTDRTWYRGDARIAQDGDEIPVRCYYIGAVDPDDDESAWEGGFESLGGDLLLTAGPAQLILPRARCATVLITSVDTSDGYFQGVGAWPRETEDTFA